MGHVTLNNFLKKTSGPDRFLYIVILIGTVLSFVSFFRGILGGNQVQVEYLKGGLSCSDEINAGLFVDIEGAVQKPGVYELVDGSRVKDVLVLAGGLSETADRSYCEKNINMAEIVKDGQKIYIPQTLNTYAPSGYLEANLTGTKISINTASIAELDTLWGIGASRAESIVKNRPYQSIDELIAKGVLTKTLVDKNRGLMSVY